jgi:hypothetical protein
VQNLLQPPAEATEAARKPLLLAEAARAHAVFVGTLVEVAPSPGMWSGLLRSAQRLDLQVEEVLGGEVPPGRVSVHQTLVALSPLTQPDPPRLADRYTQVGQRYVVLLDTPDVSGGWHTSSDTVGLTVATDALVAELRVALKR